MPAANPLHSFEGLMWGFVTLDHRAQLAGDIADSDYVRITFENYNPIKNVALRKDAQQPSAVVINHADRTDISLRHELSRFLHCRRGPRRVRLTVPNYVPDNH